MLCVYERECAFYSFYFFLCAPDSHNNWFICCCYTHTHAHACIHIHGYLRFIFYADIHKRTCIQNIRSKYTHSAIQLIKKNQITRIARIDRMGQKNLCQIAYIYECLAYVYECSEPPKMWRNSKIVMMYKTKGFKYKSNMPTCETQLWWTFIILL